MKNFNLEPLGGGAGLRGEHFQEIIENRPPFNWFEIITENFLGYGGFVRENLEQIVANYRVIPHGVCLSIGSTDPLDIEFLRRLKVFLDELKAPWYSDHLCFTEVDHTNLNELIPLPFTTECVEHVIERLRIVQDVLERPFMVENVTRYITVSDREMAENEFLTRIVEGADCGILLDVTNVYLNSQFHGYDALEFIKSLPIERIGQMHLAGWDTDGDQIIDSHDAPVPEEVWELFKKTICLTGPTSVLVEWDNNLPSVERLYQETEMADRVMRDISAQLAV